MTEAALILAVRTKCGKVTTGMGEVDDVDISREGNWILLKISERITTKLLRYITSIANQREYDVAATTLRVQKLFAPNSIDETKLKDPDRTGYTSEKGGITDEYYWPSEYLIRVMRKLRGLPSIKGTFDVVRRKLMIDPYPTIDGSKYWYISVEKSQWTLDMLPEDFEELAVLGTSWKCLEIIALKRSTLGGIHREGGFVNYPEERLRPFIDSWRNEFYEDLNLKAKLYTT